MWSELQSELEEQKKVYFADFKNSLEKGKWVAVGESKLLGTYDSRDKAERGALEKLRDGKGKVAFVTKVGHEKEVEKEEYW